MFTVFFMLPLAEIYWNCTTTCHTVKPSIVKDDRRLKTLEHAQSTAAKPPRNRLKSFANRKGKEQQCTS